LHKLARDETRSNWIWDQDVVAVGIDPL